MTKPKSSVEHGVDRYHEIDQEQDNTNQLKTIYADWADSYDYDNDHRFGTVSQPNAVALLSRHLEDRQAPILDVGCGTGIVGQCLSDVGYQCFDGTDLSPEMLEQASSRGYRNLIPSDADRGLPVEDQSYQGLICVGVFTHSHLGPDIFPALLRVVRPGGLLVFTVNEGVYETGGFDLAIQEYVESGRWLILESVKQAYMIAEGVDAWYFALKKSA